MTPLFLQRQAQRKNGAYFSTFSKDNDVSQIIKHKNIGQTARKTLMSVGQTSAVPNITRSGAAQSLPSRKSERREQENVMQTLVSEGLVPSTLEECWEEIRALREAMEILADSSLNKLDADYGKRGNAELSPKPERLSEAQRKIKDLERRNKILKDEKSMYSDLVQQLGGEESAKNLWQG